MHDTAEIKEKTNKFVPQNCSRKSALSLFGIN
jgi:hypothetical protein